jgi:transcriptional regulator GlxA family with amidase domain
LTYHIGLFLFDEVEVLDFAGPFEVFSTAARVKARIEPDHATLFKTFTVAEKPQTQARGGLIVVPNFNFNNHPKIDVLVVPGGMITAELVKEPVIGWIKQTAQSTKITASVCTGAFLLGKAGLLHHKTVTTHWEDIADLRKMLPDTLVEEKARWIDEGEIITSAGISAGIDMSLHLVARLAGEELAHKTARQMEYDWRFSEVA